MDLETETSTQSDIFPLLKGVVVIEEVCTYSVGTSDVIHMPFSESNWEAIDLLDIIVGA